MPEVEQHETEQQQLADESQTANKPAVEKKTIGEIGDRF